MNRTTRLALFCAVVLGAMAGFPPSTSAAPPKTPTSVSISTTPNPAWVDELVTITVTVTPNPGGGFVSEGGPGYPVDPTTGQATFTRSYPSAGDWEVGAFFMGTDTFAASAYSYATTTVRQHPVVLSMTLPTTTVLDLDGFDVAVALDEVPPSGTVIIQDMTSGDPGPTIGGAAVTGTSPVVVHVGGLEAGTYQLRANYTGTDTYAAAVTAPQPFTVQPAPPSSLYVDIDPQGGVFGYTITLPLAADWHTRSTSATTIVAGHSIIAGGQAIGFAVQDEHWTVQLSKASGPLAAGDYDIPTPDQLQCADLCAVVSATNAGSCLGAGAFTIHSIEYDADQILRSVNADFRLSCGIDWMSGSIRYHSSADTVALDQDVDRMFFADTNVGQSSDPQTVTITNFGSVATDLGDAALTGDGAADFDITSDTCSGAHLAVDATCVVVLAFAPTSPAIRVGQLEIADATSRGARQVRMVGSAFQPTTLTLTPTTPAFGPAPATFTYVVTPPGGSPAMFIDGVQAFGPSEAISAGGASETFTYHVTVGPGHHEVTTRFDPDTYHLGTTVDPASFDVGIGTSLDLTTTTDDGIAAGETADLVARLTAGSSLTGGTIRIRDAVTDVVLATGTASGSTSSISTGVTAALGSHRYTAEFVPATPDVQPATADHDLVAVAGPRPTTTMDSSPLYSSIAEVLLDGFGSPDGAVTFECRVDESDWFACPGPVVVHSTYADHVLSVRAVSADGLADRTPATRPWVIETVPPTATAPTETPTVGALVSGAEPVRLAWSGTDAISGVARFELGQSMDGHDFAAISTGLTASSLLRNLAPGHSYRFRIRAVDRAGNVGAWGYGSTFRLTGISQSSTAVHYRGTWVSSTSTVWWGGTARSSSTAGSTASYTFTGRSIAWVGLKAATRGKAQVYVNGVLKATVDLYSATTLRQRIVWSANYANSATRTITIKVLGTSGRPRVDVDGFIVGS